jgi:hypothetical protein
VLYPGPPLATHVFDATNQDMKPYTAVLRSNSAGRVVDSPMLQRPNNSIKTYER